ncbi:unnamed protein product [Closterium sp. NIES-65]|nr:unnamed protein product [Closterium sp. NIES-65]
MSPRVLLSPHPACSSRLPTRAPLSSPYVLLSPPRACSSLLTMRAPLSSPYVLLSSTFPPLRLFCCLPLFPSSAPLVPLYSSLPPHSLPSHSTVTLPPCLSHPIFCLASQMS